MHLSIGTMVEIQICKKAYYGVVRWCGYHPGYAVKFVGLELEEHSALGTTDGVFDKKRYFTCPPGKGYFVDAGRCRPDMRFRLTRGNNTLQDQKDCISKRKADITSKQMELSIGTMVEFSGNRETYYGVVKWCGNLEGIPGEMVGLELEEYSSLLVTTDGMFNKKRYFTCQAKKGFFTKAMKCKPDSRFGAFSTAHPAPQPDHNEEQEKEQKVTNCVTVENKENKKEENMTQVAEEHFACPICLEIVVDAVESTCCHQVYCEECIKDYLKQPCPKCRYETFDVTVSFIARQFLGNVSIDCPNDGCQVNTTRSNLKHHNEKCDYAVINCSNKGCKLNLPRQKLKQHLEDCKFTLIICSNNGCFLEANRDELKKHQLTCSFGEIICPNEGCHETIAHFKLENHLSKSCRYMVVKCPSSNCHFTGPGIKLCEHIGTEHYEYFIAHVQDMFKQPFLISIYDKNNDGVTIPAAFSTALGVPPAPAVPPDSAGPSASAPFSDDMLISFLNDDDLYGYNVTQH